MGYKMAFHPMLYRMNIWRLKLKSTTLKQIIKVEFYRHFDITNIYLKNVVNKFNDL